MKIATRKTNGFVKKIPSKNDAITIPKTTERYLHLSKFGSGFK